MHHRPMAIGRTLAALAVALATGCGLVDLWQADDPETDPIAHDLQLHALQVVSAFPAFVDAAKNSTVRVCGAPLRDDAGELLPGETNVQANGFELTVNLVSSDPNASATPPRCPGEKDHSLQVGDRLDGRTLTTAGPGATVRPGDFTVEAACYEPHATTTIGKPCQGTDAGTVAAKAVQYRREAFGCDKTFSDTAQNVAVVVDHSGSVSGFVRMDHPNVNDAKNFAEDLPGTVVNPSFKLVASDPFYSMVDGAKDLIDQLNTIDRFVTLGFDETNQVFAGCALHLTCQHDDGTVIDWSTCVTDADCSKHGASTKCGAHPSIDQDPVSQLSLADELKSCYGASIKTKQYNRYGLDLKARYSANGRAPVYEALLGAYDFLRGVGPVQPDPVRGGNAKHIVLLTDGPDTCTTNDQFLFSTFDQHGANGKVSKPGGECRLPCKFTTIDYPALLRKMAEDRFPIHIHVVQIQSMGKPAPDPTLQELACRSQGTYQFINTLDFDPNNAAPWQTAMTQAIRNVRFALAGSWRVGVQDAAFAPGGTIGRGTMTAIRGRLRWNTTQFASVGPSFTSVANRGWRFDVPNGSRDPRLPVRIACSSHADCGGGGECGVQSCTVAGLCRTANAPDLLLCGQAGKCCKGVCAGKCEGVCK